MFYVGHMQTKVKALSSGHLLLCPKAAFLISKYFYKIQGKMVIPHKHIIQTPILPLTRTMELHQTAVYPSAQYLLPIWKEPLLPKQGLVHKRAYFPFFLLLFSFLSRYFSFLYARQMDVNKIKLRHGKCIHLRQTTLL